MSKILRPLEGFHAHALYPLLEKSKISETIQWDGPKNYAEYSQSLQDRAVEVKEKKRFQYTIYKENPDEIAGSIDIRPDDEFFRADIGLWVGEKFQRLGLGTSAIREITRFGFEELKLKKIEAYIFYGNRASRRAFEKCGFRLEGTLRHHVQKRGTPVDEWVMGILPEEFHPTP